MSVLNITFSSVAGALGRQMRNFGVVGRPVDQPSISHRDMPLSRQNLEQMFEMPSGVGVARSSELQQSEWLERESMKRIRSALYADDCP